MSLPTYDELVEALGGFLFGMDAFDEPCDWDDYGLCHSHVGGADSRECDEHTHWHHDCPVPAARELLRRIQEHRQAEMLRTVFGLSS